jgi:toxin YoeB
MRNVTFTRKAFEEYNEWFDNNPQMVDRVKLLIREIDRDPFKGIGKPEPLKGDCAGYWNRRIDNEHR